jgi:phage FluMu protein Com
MSKWMAGFCSVGVMLVRYAYQKHLKCPRCGQSNETTAHIIQCTHPEAVTLWETEVNKLHKWMQENIGYPEMIDIICDSLLEWRETSKGFQSIPHAPLLRQAV